MIHNLISDGEMAAAPTLKPFRRANRTILLKGIYLERQNSDTMEACVWWRESAPVADLSSTVMVLEAGVSSGPTGLSFSTERHASTGLTRDAADPGRPLFFFLDWRIILGIKRLTLMDRRSSWAGGLENLLTRSI